MPVTRKRKAVSPEPSKQTTSSRQKHINAYGRVTKTQAGHQSAKKQRLLDSITIPTSASEQDASEKATESLQFDQPPLKAQTKPRQSKKRSRGAEEEQELATPQNKRFRNALPPTPAETPSKSASKLFEKLNIDNLSSHPSTITSKETEYDTPPLTPKSFKSLASSQPTTDLPAPVQDLTRLFSAFLTSTSLYCAHHGLGSPMYINALIPHVTKSWKKRAATERDFRVLLGVLGKNNTFELADNGEGILCLELVENTISAPGHFNQPELTQRFQQRLGTLWSEWLSTSPAAKQDMDGFFRQLPESEVVTSQVAPSKTGSLSRGQERLNDLKSGAVLARAAEATSHKPIVRPDSKTAAAVSSRGSSLLDRILAKQAANASRGNGPTQDELNRIAALDRIQDISQTLHLLANGRPRASFSTKTLISHLQNSLRNPISAEEVERCLSLMANEVTPAFVSIIQAGQVRGIVITRGGKPSPEELKQRLERARGSWGAF